jgi:hypothetical protein
VRRRRSRRGLWFTLLALLLIVGGGAAAGYWYYFINQPGAPLPFGLESLPFGLRRGTPPPKATPPPATRPASAPRQLQDTTFVRFDRLSDTLSSAVRNYHDRAALFANRQIDCAGLARGLVAIENLWINYNAERRERMASFDARRAARDQGLYGAVDSVESQFEKSKCRRP